MIFFKSDQLKIWSEKQVCRYLLYISPKTIKQFFLNKIKKYIKICIIYTWICYKFLDYCDVNSIIKIVYILFNSFWVIKYNPSVIWMILSRNGIKRHNSLRKFRVPLSVISHRRFYLPFHIVNNLSILQ